MFGAYLADISEQNWIVAGTRMGLAGIVVAPLNIILLGDNYATIKNAIRRGRTIFDNVWKFVAYLLSANLARRC